MNAQCATLLLLLINAADWTTSSSLHSSNLKFVQHTEDEKSHVVKQHQFHSGARTHSTAVNVELDQQTGKYSVFVNERPWLTGSPSFMTVDGQVLSASDGGGLSLVGLRDEEGVDNLGAWRATVLVYGPTAGKTSTTMETVFKHYRHLPHVYLFGQRYPSGVKGTSVGNKDAVTTGFPSFVHTSNSSPVEPQLGYVAFGGIMFGDTEKRIGVWNVSGIKDIVSGLDSGPLILFSDDSGTSLVISTFHNFMSASVEYQLAADGKSATASWGAIGTAAEIPPDFSIWTVICASDHGINRAMFDWGELMRYNYRRGTEYRDSDMTNNYIGYWTDNGAYYYYITESGATYEKTMIDVRDYADQLSIPYRYVQYDSWWYYKGPDEGVKEWTAMNDIFPDGMQYAWNKTSWAVIAHNRWWSNTTTYAKQNGGKYNFIVEQSTGKALPVDQEFWHDLFTESRKWGLIVYEQDWLNKQFDEMEATVTQLGLGRDWLMQMGQAARDTGLTVQYCMAPSRHALQTLEIPVVSQVRVSNDYQPGNDQWKIGISSIFAHSLGVAPFKDNFWTTTTQPGNKYNLSEPYPELQSIVATLSTGPVAPGDRINHTNAALVARSCNSDGLILKPSKPATAIDLQMHLAAFKGFSGEVWSTFSDISEWRFGVIFAADFAAGETVFVGPQEAGFEFEQSWSGVTFSWFDASHQVAPFSSNFPLKLSSCTKSEFCLYLISPVIYVGSEEFVIYGELDKWVPVSPQRINRIATIHTRDSHGGEVADVELDLRGGPGEHVIISVGRHHGPIVAISCVMSVDGAAKLSVVRQTCN